MIGTIFDGLGVGATIYLPGATGEIVALAERLATHPGCLAGANILSCLLPGMNRFDYAAMAPGARATTFLLPPQLRASFANGHVDLLPLSYSGIARFLARARIDLAVAHVAPAGPGGRASFGIAADFSPIAWERAKRRVAIVNPCMPSFPRSPSIDLADADGVIELDSPLVEIPAGEVDEVAVAIAAHAAAMVPDGAAIQVGIGSAPAAFWAALAQHRGLRLRSGMAAEPLLALADAGALAADGHVAGIAAGSRDFYRALAERDLIRLADTRETHDAHAIAAEGRFHAINSALEVDLFGQINLEWQAGRPVSGVGGAPDFTMAALASEGGRALTLLPATARGGTISRIVARLDAPAVSLPRNLADTIVTEHGVAELRDASIDERARRLIAIAAPEWRESLEREWHSVRAGMS